MVWIRFYLVRNRNWQRSLEGFGRFNSAMSVFFDGISDNSLLVKKFSE